MGILKINVDEATSNPSTSIIIICYHQGFIRGGNSKTLSSCTTEEAKTWDLLLGLRQVQELHYSLVIIEGDCQQVVLFIIEVIRQPL